MQNKSLRAVGTQPLSEEALQLSLKENKFKHSQLYTPSKQLLPVSEKVKKVNNKLGNCCKIYQKVPMVVRTLTHLF